MPLVELKIISKTYRHDMTDPNRFVEDGISGGCIMEICLMKLSVNRTLQHMADLM